MVEAITLIGERHAGERVAAVTHAVMIRLVAATILDLRGDRWRIPVGRGSLTRFEVEDGEIRLVGMPARRRRRLTRLRDPNGRRFPARPSPR